MKYRYSQMCQQAKVGRLAQKMRPSVLPSAVHPFPTDNIHSLLQKTFRVFKIKSQLASTLCRALSNYLALTSALILSPHLPNRPSHPLRKGPCLIHLCSAWALLRFLAGKIMKGKREETAFIYVGCLFLLKRKKPELGYIGTKYSVKNP